MNTAAAPSAPAPTTVHGPMIQPMSVANSMRSPARMSDWYAASRAIERRNPPWTCRAPFGRPVVPDVYASRYGCSASTSTGGSSPVPSGTLQPPSSRRHSTTCSTDGASRRASSIVSRIGTRVPRRYDQSAVITTFAPESCSLCTTAVPAKPEKIGTCTAPRWAHACEATAAAGDIGR